jgi:hypothetical protein
VAETEAWWATRCPACDAVRAIRPVERSEKGPLSLLGQLVCSNCLQAILLKGREIFAAERPALQRSSAESTEQTAGAMRQYLSPGYPDDRLLTMEGARWRVRETESGSPRKPTVLVFERVGIVRFVHDFPADWRELSDEKLCDLSRGR